MFLVSYFHVSRNSSSSSSRSGFGNVEIGVKDSRLSLDQIQEIESVLRKRYNYETAVVLNAISLAD